MESNYTNCKANIVLTKREEELFQLFLKVQNHYYQNQKLTLRVAGGWVRDKLLGLESHDIDIALDTVTGVNFTQNLQNYMKENNIGQTKGFGVIKPNPDQSKHLEAATINIDGDWLDFVNLRKEEYTADSRVPTIEFGTPEEDALRRDLTINALFYNINESKVEDFTQKGLQDQKDQRIRTPIDPIQTFQDDPLRILRVFRFAGRLKYKVSEDIMVASHDKEVTRCFLTKISRERVGKEFQSAFSKPGGIRFLQSLADADLLKIVFDNEVVKDQELADRLEKGLQYCYLLESQLLESNEVFSNLKNENFERIQMLYLLSSLQYEFNGEVITIGKKNKISLIEYFIKEKLKFGNNDIKDVYTISSSALSLILLMDVNIGKFEEEVFVTELAFWIRATKNIWEISLALARCVKPDVDYDKLLEIIDKHHLKAFYDVKPVLNGNELGTIFEVKGKDIKVMSDKILKWQAFYISNNKEECIEYLNQKP